MAKSMWIPDHYIHMLAFQKQLPQNWNHTIVQNMLTATLRFAITGTKEHSVSKAKSIKTWFAKSGVEELQQADLTPFEYLWDELAVNQACLSNNKP